jgi:hypothetical protein
MFEPLQEKLTGKDALTRAMLGTDRENFAQLFARSNVLFLQLPPGSENGLDPRLSREQLLAQIRSAPKTFRSVSSSPRSAGCGENASRSCFSHGKSS